MDELKLDKMPNNRLGFVVRKHFSRVPIRSGGQGDSYAGRQLRKMILFAFKEAIKDRKKLCIDLDGTTGYTSTFIVAAFGNIAKEFAEESNTDQRTVLERIELCSADKQLIKIIEEVENSDRKKIQIEA
jgi:STAS-like domain of unknown function (DUF4325)